MPPAGGILKLLAFCIVLALLICNTATGFAGGLAGSLAFTASTILCAFAQIARLNRFDMFHNRNLQSDTNSYISVYHFMPL